MKSLQLAAIAYEWAKVQLDQCPTTDIPSRTSKIGHDMSDLGCPISGVQDLDVPDGTSAIEH